MTLRLGAGVAVAVIGAGAVAVARHSPEFSLAGDATALELAVGWCLAGAGLALCRPLLVAAGAAWFVVEFNNPGVGSSLLYTLGLLLAALCPVLIAHAALGERALVAPAYVAAIVGLGLIPALFFDPGADGCGSCPRNLLDIADTNRELTRIGLVLGIGWAIALVALMIWRILDASPARRRLVAPVLVPAAVYLLLVALGFAHGARRGFQSNDPTDHRLWLAQALALLAVTGGFAWDWVRDRRTRAALAQVVVELGNAPEPGGLRDVLAERLHDPSLQLVYAHGDGWIDLDGRPARPAAVTPLVAGGRAVAGLVHRPGALADLRTAEEIAATGRLALEYERLHAELRAQIAHLRASRGRIVAAEDAQRRRLERDLHDGAQQRLVTLALKVRLAARHAEDGRDLEHAEEDLRAGLTQLRELAHGLHPLTLTEGGLAAAVEALAESNPRLAAGTLTPERFAADVESAAYFVIAETLKRTHPEPLDVEVIRAGPRLVIELRGPAPEDLVDLNDRVGALDGRLHGDATGITAELPCG